MKLNFVIIESAFRTSNHYLIKSFINALRTQPGVDEIVELDIFSALNKYPNQKIDVLIVFGGEQADSYVLRHLRERARLKLVWYLEDPYEFDENYKSAKHYDIILTNDQAASHRYSHGAHHVPLAAEMAYTTSFIPFDVRRYDLSFIATLWPNRAQFLKESESVLKNLKTKLVCSENSFIAEKIKQIKAPVSLSNGVDYLDFMRINQQSRMSLMIDREFSGSGNYTVSDTPGPRLFEAASAGACPVVDLRVAGDAISALGFVEGVDYFGFSSVDDFRRVVERFIHEQRVFEDAAKQIQKKVAEHHTYSHRAQKIVELAQQEIRHRESNWVFKEENDQEDQPVRVLALTHDLLKFGFVGGAEIYMEELASKSQQFEVYQMSRDGRMGYGTRYVLVDREGTEVLERVPRCPVTDEDLRSTELEEFFLECCEFVRPEVILVNHLLGHTPSLLLIAQHMGLPYLVVIHDYYFACDQFNLMFHNKNYCAVNRPNDEQCSICTTSRRNSNYGAQYLRRSVFGYLLQRAEAVICNTPSSAQILQNVTGISMRNLSIIEPPKPPNQTLERKTNAATDRTFLRVAVLGNIHNNKGLDDLVQVAIKLRDKQISFEVFGRANDSLVAAINEHGLTNIVCHGPYEPNNLPKAVSFCTVALFLSKWPETYCMTLTEALNFGLVPVSYDIGALGERITDEVGIKVAPDPLQIVAVLIDLVNNPQKITRLEQLVRKQVIAPDKFIAAYQRLLVNVRKTSAGTNRQSPNKVDLEYLWAEWIPRKWDLHENIDARTQASSTRLRSLGRKIKTLTRRFSRFVDR